MNSNLKNLLYFLVGGAIGAGSTYLWLKKSYDKRCQDEIQAEIEKLREKYDVKYGNKGEKASESVENDENSTKKSSKNPLTLGMDRKKEITKYKTIIKHNDYDQIDGHRERIIVDNKVSDDEEDEIDDDLENEECEFSLKHEPYDPNATHPYIIDETDHDLSENDYIQLECYYIYKKNLVIIDDGNQMWDVDKKIGLENIEKFRKLCEETEDIYNNGCDMWVRNEKYVTDYHLIYDEECE